MAQVGGVPIPETWQSGYLQLRKRVEDQEKIIAEMQRSLCGVVKLFEDLRGAESLVRSTHPHGFQCEPDGRSGQEFLLSVDSLRRERSERAHHVLFSVYLPHLGLVRTRVRAGFEEKKKGMAALVGSWSSACAKKKIRAEWLETLSDAERGLWKYIQDLDPFPYMFASDLETPSARFDFALKVVWDLPCLWKVLLKEQNPSLLATKLMMPVLLGRQGYYAVQKRVRYHGRDHPFDRTLPNMKLLVPLDPEFFSLRRHVLLLLWQAAIADPRIPGVRALCHWLVTASHVGDQETVRLVGSYLTEQQRVASAQWVARRIGSFHLRSSGRVLGSGVMLQMGWRGESTTRYMKFFEEIRCLPKAKRRALVLSQAERVCAASEEMKKFLSDVHRSAGGGGGIRNLMMQIGFVNLETHLKPFGVLTQTML
uniref:Uncharacterized protein n=1 Tax=Chromera velia CCMP2878 TaxID=1169474 RepID=A0A0G4GHN3_9ALVE|eukprot:Cvel_21932.t1-p1 / transcript=Cvel_21932.t1 / gene=Cvel_21932 / organism=Chromera_velia_CCMP2878 / gene_product=hypothetical protein / transcript_product=hypothetical protein / location=Cvel_scaffold2104:858-2126(-) / protein_length=423 / sequence_SO=supercontig / SO=protein_coding / is_pseudo=false